MSELGEITMNYCTGEQWICTKAGQPGNWIKYSGIAWSSLTEATSLRLKGKISEEEYALAAAEYELGNLPE